MPEMERYVQWLALPGWEFGDLQGFGPKNKVDSIDATNLYPEANRSYVRSYMVRVVAEDQS